MKKSPIISILSLWFLCLAPARAVLPDEILSDTGLEARAREISKELRCVVCQNQTIDDSNAPLARDMRILVRERLTAGDSNDEVKAYLVERYGDFVLMRPPVKTKTMVLWLGPLAFVGAGFLGFGLCLRNARREAVAEVAPLTPAEKAALAEATPDEQS